jgi:hypothetical protein
MTFEEWFKQIESKICPFDLCRTNEFVDFIFKGMSNSLDNLLEDSGSLICIYYHDYLNKILVLDGYSKVDIEMKYVDYMLNKKLKEYGWMAKLRIDKSKRGRYENVENLNYIDIHWWISPIY